MPPRGVTSYAALLRAVNVAGHAPVSMADLRAFVSAVGFKDVETLLQSGNVVFRGAARSPSKLEKFFEAEAAERLGLETDIIVRSAAEWDEIVARNPFAEEALADPGHLVVMFLKGVATAPNVTALQQAIVGPEVVRADGKQLYITYPAGIGRSKLTNALIERKLGVRATGRNWNTVSRIHAVLQRHTPTE